MADSGFAIIVVDAFLANITLRITGSTAIDIRFVPTLAVVYAAAECALVQHVVAIIILRVTFFWSVRCNRNTPNFPLLAVAPDYTIFAFGRKASVTFRSNTRHIVRFTITIVIFAVAGLQPGQHIVHAVAPPAADALLPSIGAQAFADSSLWPAVTELLISVIARIPLVYFAIAVIVQAIAGLFARDDSVGALSPDPVLTALMSPAAEAFLLSQRVLRSWIAQLLVITAARAFLFVNGTVTVVVYPVSTLVAICPGKRRASRGQTQLVARID
ncbi:hypothetical protein WME90_42915 [Sorangium sp. So ce375]|uniref:hypothetical protein n=1 Tax=Sorangium sp. So ce375 TaxID=3133306 RepID=UPI003F5C9B3E